MTAVGGGSFILQCYCRPHATALVLKLNSKSKFFNEWMTSRGQNSCWHETGCFLFCPKLTLFNLCCVLLNGFLFYKLVTRLYFATFFAKESKASGWAKSACNCFFCNKSHHIRCGQEFRINVHGVLWEIISQGKRRTFDLMSLLLKEFSKPSAIAYQHNYSS